MAGTDLTPRGVHPWVAQSRSHMRFGVSIYRQPLDWQEFVRVVQEMEAGGIDSYWSYDHPQARADCWTALAVLAASTSTIRLGTLVDCIYYRSPYLLARQAADVDRISNGRLILGLGIGDNVPEFEQMGIQFPPTKARQEAMEETIAILRGLWSDDSFEFQGKHFSAKSDGMFVGPVQEPRVPICSLVAAKESRCGRWPVLPTRATWGPTTGSVARSRRVTSIGSSTNSPNTAKPRAVPPTRCSAAISPCR